MQRKSEGQMKVRIVGNYTEPRTWGVYRVSHNRGAPTYHFGNHPVRQRELENEFGNAELIELYLDRESAQQHKRELNK
jgi:hypothetical protein